jgi:hypothetical protein
MNCEKKWNRETLIEMFSYTFVNKIYKKHRESVLFDQQLSMMEETQTIIEERNKIKQFNQDMRDIDTEIRRLRNLKYEKLNNRDATISRGATNYYGHCPVDECKGFITASWECGICETKVCKSCKEMLTKGHPHECDPNVITTLQQIKKDCRHCPKCKVNIQRIHGCFDKDTPMLMYDGSTKMVQDLIIGDTLLGDDGTIRTIQKLCTGIDEMYTVDQSNGIN